MTADRIHVTLSVAGLSALMRGEPVRWFFTDGRQLTIILEDAGIDVIAELAADAIGHVRRELEAAPPAGKTPDSDRRG